MNDDFDLPVFYDGESVPSLKSIEEINKWIEEDYRLFFDRASYEREKERCSVNIVFRLE